MITYGTHLRHKDSGTHVIVWQQHMIGEKVYYMTEKQESGFAKLLSEDVLKLYYEEI